MPNRTEMLHFRATPEEKAVIRENAGHAELALSEWMRQRSLDRLIPAFEDPVTRENKAKVRQAREEGKPLDIQVVPGSLVPTQPAVWDCCGASKTSGKHAWNCPLIVEQDVSADSPETYEQFMERRVGELVGSVVLPRPEAEAAAEVEWAERGRTLSSRL